MNTQPIQSFEIDPYKPNQMHPPSPQHPAETGLTNGNDSKIQIILIYVI